MKNWKEYWGQRDLDSKCAVATDKTPCHHDCWKCHDTGCAINGPCTCDVGIEWGKSNASNFEEAQKDADLLEQAQKAMRRRQLGR